MLPTIERPSADRATSVRSAATPRPSGSNPEMPNPAARAAVARLVRDSQAGSLAATPASAGQAPRRQATLDLPTFGPPVGLSNMAGEKMVEAAAEFLGQPYARAGGHRGTMDEVGPVDCSGLVQQAGRSLGMNFDGTAADQQKMGKPVDMKDLKPGDLVFRGAPAYHVGIYAGEGQVIHAPRAGSEVSYVPASYFQSARRVVG